MIIVTSGKRYIDIDAYAGCIAYANLLKLKGIEAKAMSTAKINRSVTQNLLKLNSKLDDNVVINNDDEFVIIDLSNKDFLDKIVDQNKIIEIIDHHAGYEEYWKNKLGEKARIEFIGAVATIIVELYEKENLMEKMTNDIAILLMSAILDNTLNFKAKITTDRDKIAYKKLENIVDEGKNYAQKYFLECQSNIERDLIKAIEDDTKIENINYILPSVIGQITIWDKNNIIDNKHIICNTLNNIGNEWMMNIICLQDEKSYIIASNLNVQRNLEKLLNGKFRNDIMELDDVFLRKEIMKMAIELKNVNE